MKKLQELLEDDDEDFELLENVKKLSCVQRGRKRDKMGSCPQCKISKCFQFFRCLRSPPHYFSDCHTFDVLGSELWESKFDGLFSLVKGYIMDVWEIRKHKLYDSDSGSGLLLHSQTSPGERSGKFSPNGMQVW